MIASPQQTEATVLQLCSKRTHTASGVQTTLLPTCWLGVTDTELEDTLWQFQRHIACRQRSMAYAAEPNPQHHVLLPSRLGPISTIWIGCVLQFCGYAGMYIAATRHLPASHSAMLE